VAAGAAAAGRPCYHAAMSRRDRPIPRGAVRIELPNLAQQKAYTCGVAALQAVCAYFGVGPGDEATIEAHLGIDRRIGTHPHQLRRVARRYGLSVEEHQPMATATLLARLDRGRPVLLTLQAWGGRASYARAWKHGHWVVAIGHDRAGVYFQDPAIAGARGFLAHAALAERWHDVGPRGVHLERYGLVLWRPGVGAPAWSRRARRIG
jgi:predicted double-glycine peptidase